MRQYILAFVVMVSLLSGIVAAGDEDAVREVKEALNALNKAFEKGDAESIKKLMTADHVAVTVYYGGALRREEQLGSLAQLKFSEYTAGKMSVRLLGRDVALITYPLTMKGTFKGREVPRNSFASAVWVKTEGRWQESFYQETSFTAVGSTPAGDADEDAFKRELKALAGTWRPISIETDGKKVPEEGLKELSAIRDEAGKVVVTRGDMVVLEARVRNIDASKKPKTFDSEEIFGKQKGKIVQGIYEIDGDTLRVCVVLPGKGERPTEFSAKAGSGCTLIVYKREKK